MEGDELKAKRPVDGTMPVRVRSKAMPEGLKRWLVTSLTVLLVSLVAFVVDVVIGFSYFTQKTAPLPVRALGLAAMLGMALGFLGVCMVFLKAVVRSRKEDK